MNNLNESSQSGKMIMTWKKLSFGGVVGLLLISLVALTASAFSSESNSMKRYFSQETKSISEPSEKELTTPTGTFPTMLTNISVVSASNSEMKIQGRLTTVGGRGVASQRVDIYSVAEGSFARITTAYTDGSGNFSITTTKPPAGRKIQIGLEGNGAYNTPYPTFNRP